MVLTMVGTAPRAATAADDEAPTPRRRRILLNLDGDGCMIRKKGIVGATEITPDDLRATVAEIAYPGSQVDTMLLCVNAQVMYYPSKAGTMRGTLDAPEERVRWEFPTEEQRFRNVEAMFAQGVDPYALLLAEAQERGLEALLSYRMNDAHGCTFLQSKLWRDHPEYRLGAALDFGQEAVRDYTFRLIEEAVQRYDCDGLEMDFNRFPNFFSGGTEAERIDAVNDLVRRVRQMIDRESQRRGRQLVLAARVPTSYQQCREVGLDPVVWAREGWTGFLTISEFLYTRYDLPVKPWKELISEVPIYASIEFNEGDPTNFELYMTAAKYRRAARHLWADGADGVYLFNFFRFSIGEEQFEPPSEVLSELGDPEALQAKPGAEQHPTR